jgi:glycine betaine/choline ABC-type transport system substrate-binding protein
LDAYDLSELSVTFSVAQDLDPVRQIVAAASTEALSRRGADVMTATPLTSADQRSALQTGTADMYVDYDQAADLANGVVWLGPAPANVGPGIAVVDDGLTSVQDVTDRISTSEGKLCVDSSELETATSDLVTLGLDPRDPTSVVPISPTELTRALTSGRCIAAYVAQQTDARLTGSPSRFVTDGDRQLPIMRIGVALRQGIAADEPDLSQLVGDVLDALDDQQIAALVSRVELGERPEAVATDWLEVSGLL